MACSIVLATVLASARARAADDDEEDQKPKRESYFAISLAGGLLSPLGDMAGDSKLNLGLRVGYVGSSGFGLLLSGEWSPLGRTLGSAGDSQMFGFSVGPAYTGGAGVTRGWVSLGGGLLSEATSSTSKSAGTFNAVAGVELHFFSNGGLSVQGSYTRGFSGDYNYAALLGGLVFTL